MKIDPSLRKDILSSVSSEDLLLCYQCGKCSSICPVFIQSGGNIFNPRKIIEMANLGARDVIEGDMIWKCTTCYECVENCPQNINFVSLILGLRNIAVRNGFSPKEVLGEFHTLLEEGYILKETTRIRQIKESAGLYVSTVDNGANDLAKILGFLRKELKRQNDGEKK